MLSEGDLEGLRQFCNGNRVCLVEEIILVDGEEEERVCSIYIPSKNYSKKSDTWENLAHELESIVLFLPILFLAEFLESSSFIF